MQVKHSKTAFADARAFVSAVGSNRCPFFTHPAYDVAPVGTFGQLGGATNASSGFGIGGLGGVMGAAGAFSLASMDVEVTTSESSADSMCFRMWYLINYYSMCCCMMGRCCGFPKPGRSIAKDGLCFKLWYADVYYLCGCCFCGKSCGFPKPKLCC
jgi:hypothetical protein